MRFDQFFAFVVNVFFSAEPEIVEDQDLPWLDLADFLDGMGAYDVFHELDPLGAVLS